MAYRSSMSGGNYPNMNPALNNPSMNQSMNIPPGNVQVMNMLDAGNSLEQMMSVDQGYLQGLPVSMLDWGECSCSCRSSRVSRRGR